MAATNSLATWKTCPNPVFSTSTAKANCRPRPQNRIRPLIAFFWEDSAQATARIKMSPRIPRNRSIAKSADYFENQFARFGFVLGNAEGVFHHFGSLFETI